MLDHNNYFFINNKIFQSQFSLITYFIIFISCVPKENNSVNSLTLQKNSNSFFGLVAEPIATCVDVLPENVTKGETYMKCDGSNAVGTLEPSSTTATVACTADGQQNCLSTATLKSVNTATISASDIKVGKTIAGIAGTFVPGSTLNVCKNGQSNATYNNNGVPANGASNDAGGANQYDWWDSVDEYGNMTYPAAFSGAGAAWGSESFCNGSTFTNVTSTLSWLTPTTGVNCGVNCTAANAFNKIMYDSLTQFYVTNVLIESSTAPTNPCVGGGGCMNINEALSACANIDSGDGTGKWRVPTIKELSALYISGIFGLNTSQFSDLLDDIFWSSTRDSADPINSIHTLRFHTGEQYAFAPTMSQALICIRN